MVVRGIARGVKALTPVTPGKGVKKIYILACRLSISSKPHENLSMIDMLSALPRETRVLIVCARVSHHAGVRPLRTRRRERASASPHNSSCAPHALPVAALIHAERQNSARALHQTRPRMPLALPFSSASSLEQSDVHR